MKRQFLKFFGLAAIALFFGSSTSFADFSLNACLIAADGRETTVSGTWTVGRVAEKYGRSREHSLMVRLRGAAEKEDYIHELNQYVKTNAQELGLRAEDVSVLSKDSSSNEIWKLISKIGPRFAELMIGQIENNPNYQPDRAIEETTDLAEKSLIKKRLKKSLKKFLPKFIKRRGRLALMLEGIDSAGKGITIKLFSEVLDELIDENPKFAAHLKVIKLGKPDKVLNKTQDYVDRWTEQIPDEPGEAAIYLLDRGPLHNRLVTEPAWEWIDDETAERFEKELSVVEKKFREKRVRVYSIWSNISLEHFIYNLVRRVTTEQRQHLNSPVDARGIEMWDEYISHQRKALKRLQRQGLNVFYTNGSRLFNEGGDSTLSRLTATVNGIGLVLQRDARLRSLFGWMMPSEKNSLVQKVREFSFSRPSFSNTRLQDPEVLQSLNRSLDKLRALVRKGVDNGVLRVNPIHDIRNHIDLRQKIPKKLLLAYVEMGYPLEPLVVELNRQERILSRAR